MTAQQQWVTFWGSEQALALQNAKVFDQCAQLKADGFRVTLTVREVTCLR